MPGLRSLRSRRLRWQYCDGFNGRLGDYFLVLAKNLEAYCQSCSRYISCGLAIEDNNKYVVDVVTLHPRLAPTHFSQGCEASSDTNERDPASQSPYSNSELEMLNHGYHLLNI